MRGHLLDSVRAFRSVFSNRELRKVQLAAVVDVNAQWGCAVAFGVYAYMHGGATAVGLITLVRTLPAAVFAPFAGSLADRFPRAAVMAGANAGRAASAGLGAAVMLAGGPAWVVYAVACLSAISATAFGPAESALLPSLAASPEELTAANVSLTSINAVGTFVGPAAAGAIMAFASPGWVFLAGACALVVAALIVTLIDEPRAEREEHGPTVGVLAGTGAGFATVARTPRLRVLVGLFAAKTMGVGALQVLFVVVAIDVFHRGDSGVGYVSAASGVGGIVGAVLAFALVGRQRLGGDLAFGLALWAVPLALIGIWPHVAVALLAFGVLGLADTVVDSSAFTLLQRAAPPDVIARVFGVLQMVAVLAIGLGAALTPALIALTSERTALVAIGVALPVLAGLAWPRLAEIDAESVVPAEELAALQAVPMFAALPAPTLEQLAAALVPAAAAAGTDVVREGDVGEGLYLVRHGELVVESDGRELRRLGPGDVVGEIALLRDVPRTATVRAVTDVRLYSLDGEAFLAAVTTHAPSMREADALVGGRLAVTVPA